MKLAVLGATGKTGMEVVQQALAEGHLVTAVVRNIAKMTVITHENLKVIESNIFNKESLTGAFREHDVVISCLGFPMKPKPVTGYSASIATIIPAMREANVSRLITMTSMYTDVSSAARGGFIVNWLIVPFLRPVLGNMYEMEKYLESSGSDINYTVIRPPTLGNGPKTGRPLNVAEDYMVDNKTSVNKVSRADVAAFMLGCLKTDMYNKKMIAIAMKK